MSKYKVIEPETLSRMARCFTDSDEIKQFALHLGNIMDEIHFNMLLLTRVSKEETPLVLMKQICVFTVFCREHMEVIQELIRELDMRDMTDKEAQDYRGVL